jgi:hypothetical protein
MRTSWTPSIAGIPPLLLRCSSGLAFHGRRLEQRSSGGRSAEWTRCQPFKNLQLFEHAFLSRSNMGICDRNHLIISLA